MNPCVQLLAIKKLREESADRACRAQRLALEAAAVRRDAAQRQLDEYRDYSRQEEQRMYGRLCERVVRLGEIEDARAGVLLLRSREREHADHLDAAEAQRTREEEQLSVDRKAHADALCTLDKFIELNEVFAQQSRVEAERHEEAEIEEAAGAGARRDVAGELA